MSTDDRPARPESCYRAVKAATGASTASSTPPSAPPASTAGRRARRARRRYSNVTFHPSAAAAQAAGYRACKRCLPDATPGSPDWDVAADVAGRAMRLIADGVVDREGVDGLARRVGYTPAPPHPAAHRRARRRPAGPGPGPARPDRAGADRDHRPRLRRRRVRGRLRQRPPVQRHDPRGVRRHARPSCAGARGRGAPTGTVSDAARGPHAVRRPRPARLPRRPARSRASRRPATAGTPAPSPCRTAPAPSGSSSTTTPTGQTAFVHRDVPRSTTCATSPPAVERARRLLDADCDPVAVDDAFAGDPLHRAAGARARPGCGCPATSTATSSPSAPCSASRSASPAPAPSPPGSPRSTASRSRRPDGELTHLFPTPATLAAARPRAAADAARPRAGRWSACAAALADGDVALDRGADRDDVRRRCWRCPASGRGRPTTSRCARSATPTCSCRPTSASATRCGRLGRDPADAADLAEGWRPWRSYAQLHLWQTLSHPNRLTRKETLTCGP